MKAISNYEMPVIREDRLVGKGLDMTEREAYERGFQSGEKAGLELGMQKAQVVLEKLEAALRSLTAMRENIAQRLEAQCVELAAGMARKIVLNEIRTKPEAMVAMAREALAKIERSGRITIKIHPTLKDLFQKHRPDMLAVHPDIVYDIDPSLSQYGATVMGPAEEVTTDIDEQIKSLIKDMVAGRAGD